MKKLVVILFLIGFSENASAQGNLQLTRLDASAGIFPSHNELYLFSAPQTFLAQVINPEIRQSTPTLFLGVSFFQMNKIEIGIEAGYQSTYLHNSMRDGPDQALIEPEHPMQAFSFIPRFRFQWLQTDDQFLEMYSSLSFGLTFIHEGGPVNLYYPEPAAHLNFFGISMGNEMRGFMEFGIGSKGLISAGITYSP